MSTGPSSIGRPHRCNHGELAQRAGRAGGEGSFQQDHRPRARGYRPSHEGEREDFEWCVIPAVAITQSILINTFPDPSSAATTLTSLKKPVKDSFDHVTGELKDYYSAQGRYTKAVDKVSIFAHTYLRII
jgi:hypothetical protein